MTNTILTKRNDFGLSQSDFARLLEVDESTIQDWENGTKRPSTAKMKIIEDLQTSTPYKRDDSEPKFTFIDLFAGVGGIRMPYQELGGKCVFSSEWDKFSQKTYAVNYGEVPSGDITKIQATDIPDHDILLGGFPCQTFSQAGLKKGFSDTRGTMFFEIQRIIAEKRPKAFMLENVKQLRTHDGGRTLQTILDILEGRNSTNIPLDIPMSDDARNSLSKKLNYQVFYTVLKAADFGVPQNRERIFIVGFDRDQYPNIDFSKEFSFPPQSNIPTKLGDILETNVPSKYTLSSALWAGHQRRKAGHLTKGNGFGYTLYDANSPYTNTLSARYYKDGSEILIDQSNINQIPRKLTPRECARLQGFPEDFIIDVVSDSQMYKQFGNSVTVPVIRALANQIINTLQSVNGGVV